MADYEMEVKTYCTTETRYVLPLPSNGTEVQKMINAAGEGWRRGNPRGPFWDDAIAVTSDGETLVLSWSVREEMSRG